MCLFLLGSATKYDVPRGVASASLSMAMASGPYGSIYDLLDVLFVSRCAQTALDRQGWPVSRVLASKLSHAERLLLAYLLVFCSACTNVDSCIDQIKTVSSLSKGDTADTRWWNRVPRLV